MSIKGDVLEHLLNHRGEVISLTALASTLDTTLDTVRNTISTLRSDRKYGGAMRDDIKIVSRGYAVKYVGPPAPAAEPTKPTPADVPKKHVTTTVADVGSNARPATVEVVADDTPKPGPLPTKPTPSNVDSEPKTSPAREVVAPVHPYTDDLEEVLGQLGPVAYKVFLFIASQNGQNVTVIDIAEGTGLGRGTVASACYNTLYNRKQLNRNAARMFVKVGIDVYRLSLPGDGVKIDGPGQRNSQFPAELPVVPNKIGADPVVGKITEKLYGGNTSSTNEKRIFEELRALPDGAILIEDENGCVYKAREV